MKRMERKTKTKHRKAPEIYVGIPHTWHVLIFMFTVPWLELDDVGYGIWIFVRLEFQGHFCDGFGGGIVGVSFDAGPQRVQSFGEKLENQYTIIVEACQQNVIVEFPQAGECVINEDEWLFVFDMVEEISHTFGVCLAQEARIKNIFAPVIDEERIGVAILIISKKLLGIGGFSRTARATEQDDFFHFVFRVI